MLGPHFYNEAIRKTVIGFGTLFNNIEHRKYDNTGAVIEAEKVPLAYGPQNKFLTRLEQNPTVDKKVAITLPRLYFEMSGITYDSSRKIAPTQKYKTIIQGEDEVRIQYVPVPYNMEFELGIIAKSQDTGLQILEQILPYFQPNFNITLNMIPDMNEKKDVSIILNSINYADDWDDNFLDRRSIVWTLMFTAKSFIYGPFNKSDVIKKAIVYESIGDKNQSKRATKLTYSPKAKEDKNQDGVIDAADDALVISTDDFGFNEGIELL
tara:strand:+ start:577 stop:1374 length:798 start_codon:yes stop_codon:yes gene_type:complete